MKTLSSVIKEYKKFLETNRDIDEIEDYLGYPFYEEKAKEEEIAQTEKRLGCKLPTELKEYYLNLSNGTEPEVEGYEDVRYETRLEIFSHQKIMGIVEYSSLYWESEDMDAFEYNTAISEPLNEEEKVFLKEKNREYFVCIVDWDENFIETFVFDKEGNFYQFYFDQDETVSDYINEMIKGSPSMKKDKSLGKLLDEYLNEDEE